MSCIPGLSHRKGLALEVIKSVSLIDSKNLDMKVLNCPENIHTPLKVILSSILQENDILKLMNTIKAISHKNIFSQIVKYYIYGIGSNYYNIYSENEISTSSSSNSNIYSDMLHQLLQYILENSNDNIYDVLIEVAEHLAISIHFETNDKNKNKNNNKNNNTKKKNKNNDNKNSNDATRVNAMKWKLLCIDSLVVTLTQLAKTYANRKRLFQLGNKHLLPLLSLWTSIINTSTSNASTTINLVGKEENNSYKEDENENENENNYADLKLQVLQHLQKLTQESFFGEERHVNELYRLPLHQVPNAWEINASDKHANISFYVELLINCVMTSRQYADSSCFGVLIEVFSQVSHSMCDKNSSEKHRNSFKDRDSNLQKITSWRKHLLGILHFSLCCLTALGVYYPPSESESESEERSEHTSEEEEKKEKKTKKIVKSKIDLLSLRQQQTRNVILDTMSTAIKGALPNHESMLPYLDSYRTIAKNTIERAMNVEKDLDMDVNVDVERHQYLYLELNCLKILMHVDHRIVLRSSIEGNQDEWLQNTILSALNVISSNKRTATVFVVDLIQMMGNLRCVHYFFGTLISLPESHHTALAMILDDLSIQMELCNQTRALSLTQIELCWKMLADNDNKNNNSSNNSTTTFLLVYLVRPLLQSNLFYVGENHGHITAITRHLKSAIELNDKVECDNHSSAMEDNCFELLSALACSMAKAIVYVDNIHQWEEFILLMKEIHNHVFTESGLVKKNNDDNITRKTKRRKKDSCVSDSQVVTIKMNAIHVVFSISLLMTNLRAVWDGNIENVVSSDASFDDAVSSIIRIIQEKSKEIVDESLLRLMKTLFSTSSLWVHHVHRDVLEELVNITAMILIKDEIESEYQYGICQDMVLCHELLLQNGEHLVGSNLLQILIRKACSIENLNNITQVSAVIDMLPWNVRQCASQEVIDQLLNIILDKLDHADDHLNCLAKILLQIMNRKRIQLDSSKALKYIKLVVNNKTNGHELPWIKLLNQSLVEYVCKRDENTEELINIVANETDLIHIVLCTAHDLSALKLLSMTKQQIGNKKPSMLVRTSLEQLNETKATTIDEDVANITEIDDPIAWLDKMSMVLNQYNRNDNMISIKLSDNLTTQMLAKLNQIQMQCAPQSNIHYIEFGIMNYIQHVNSFSLQLYFDGILQLYLDSAPDSSFALNVIHKSMTFVFDRILCYHYDASSSLALSQFYYRFGSIIMHKKLNENNYLCVTKFIETTNNALHLLHMMNKNDDNSLKWFQSCFFMLELACNTVLQGMLVANLNESGTLITSLDCLLATANFVDKILTLILQSRCISNMNTLATVLRLLLTNIVIHRSYFVVVESPSWIPLLSQVARNMVIIARKIEFRRQVPYVLSTILDSISHSEISRDITDHVFPGIIALYDVCSSADRKFVLSMLDAEGQNLYTTLHEKYLLDYKFTGKS